MAIHIHAYVIRLFILIFGQISPTQRRIDKPSWIPPMGFYTPGPYCIPCLYYTWAYSSRICFGYAFLLTLISKYILPSTHMLLHTHPYHPPTFNRFLLSINKHCFTLLFVYCMFSWNSLNIVHLKALLFVEDDYDWLWSCLSHFSIAISCCEETPWAKKL